MALVVENWNGFVEVASAMKTNHIANALVGSDVLTKLADATFKQERFGGAIFGALVFHRDGKSWNQEGALARTSVDLGQI